MDRTRQVQETEGSAARLCGSALRDTVNSNSEMQGGMLQGLEAQTRMELSLFLLWPLTVEVKHDIFTLWSLALSDAEICIHSASGVLGLWEKGGDCQLFPVEGLK